MNNYIKFPLVFLKNVLLENKVKSFFLLVCVTSFIFADTFENSKDMIPIYKQYVYEDDMLGKTYIYIYKSIGDGKISYNIHQSDKPVEMLNGSWVKDSYNGFNVLMWILFFLSVVMLIIALIIGIGDDSVAWNFKSCMGRSMGEFIRCEEENGKFYYILFGRLIEVSDRLYHNRYGNVLSDLGVNGFSSLKLYPKFDTKSNKRQKLLDKLC